MTYLGRDWLITGQNGGLISGPAAEKVGGRSWENPVHGFWSWCLVEIIHTGALVCAGSGSVISSVGFLNLLNCSEVLSGYRMEPRPSEAECPRGHLRSVETGEKCGKKVFQLGSTSWGTQPSQARPLGPELDFPLALRHEAWQRKAGASSQRCSMDH